MADTDRFTVEIVARAKRITVVDGVPVVTHYWEDKGQVWDNMKEDGVVMMETGLIDFLKYLNGIAQSELDPAAREAFMNAARGLGNDD